MKIEQSTHRKLRIQNYSFVILFLIVAGFIAYLSNEHNAQYDWSSTNRNTLSSASIKLLSQLDKPLHFSVYATEDNTIRNPIDNLIKRYQHEKPSITVEYINPELEPVLTRELGISMNGEVIIDYGDRDEHLTEHTEQAYTNTLQRLSREEQRWLSFITGHGERDPSGMANHDLSEWVQQLSSKGISGHSLNLTQQPNIPDNTSVLIIAGPQVDYLSGEVEIISRYIAAGGNLLWLADPGPLYNLEPLADQLGIQFQDGVVVDPTTQVFGIADPRVALITQYPHHPITNNFDVLTLFPQARSMLLEPPKDWRSTALLTTLDRSWAEVGKIKGEIEFNQGHDIAGPLIIGAALTRKLTEQNNQSPSEANANSKTQRIVVIGNGDFLSNAFLGNGGNLDLGMSIANWLSHDDKLVAIPTKTAPDIHLDLSQTTLIVLAFILAIAIPLSLIIAGVLVWLKRRNR